MSSTKCVVVLLLLTAMRFAYGAEKTSPSAARIRAGAEQGKAKEQFMLGQCYGEGIWVEKDVAEAARWYRKAAVQGHRVAQHHLGVCYADGTGVAQDAGEAAMWFRKAAEQGFAEAQFELGKCCLQGEGTLQDDVEAAQWMQKAADQGHVEAMMMLSDLYANGRGVAKDDAEAATWSRKAEAIRKKEEDRKAEEKKRDAHEEVPAARTEYTVQEGDDMYSVAVRFGVTPMDIRKCNNLEGSLLGPGTVIKVPSSVLPLPPRVSAGVVSRKYRLAHAYTVQEEDDIYSVAVKFMVRPGDLRAYNHITGSALVPGSVVKIPVSE